MAVLLFDVHLSVEIKEDLMVAHLLFVNNTQETLYLDEMTLCSKNKIERKVFKITDQDNKEVSYRGYMQKRILEPEDFITLDVGQKIQTSVILDEVYQLRKGKKYIIQYDAFNPGSLKEDDDVLIKMESNKVEVVYDVADIS